MGQAWRRHFGKDPVCNANEGGGTLSLNMATEFGGARTERDIKVFSRLTGLSVCLSEDWILGSTGLASCLRSLCFRSRPGLGGKSHWKSRLLRSPF